MIAKIMSFNNGYVHLYKARTRHIIHAKPRKYRGYDSA